MKISIKGARIERHMTQKQVAKAMKVTKETISNWERGKTAPTAPQLLSLCELYKVTVSDIFLPDEFAKSENENEVQNDK